MKPLPPRPSPEHHVDQHTIRKVAEDGTVTFETEQRWVHMPHVMTVEEAKAAEDAQAVVAANDAIKAQLRDADVAALRALYEGDTERLKAHAASQAELRKKLRS